MASDKFIIVVGMPGSGTSMAAGALHHLGVDMGRIEHDWIQPDTGELRKPFNTYECRDYVKIGDTKGTLKEYMTRSLEYFRKRKLNATGRVGVKNIRLMWMGYDERIETLKHRIEVVFVHRNLESVFLSDIKYQGRLDPERGQWLGAQFMALATFGARVKQTVRLECPDCKKNPRGMVEKLVEGLSLDVTQEQYDAAVGSVRPKHELALVGVSDGS